MRTQLQTHFDSQPGVRSFTDCLFSVVGVLLAIACANVANLMLARGQARAREIAVRLAIGASRGRLIRQLMSESLLIALLGGALGVALVTLFLKATSGVQVIPGDIPLQLNFEVNGRVLWFTVAVSIASAVLFGLGPALQATRTNLVSTLKTGEADQARQRLFGRSAMVAVQVAGSLVLLVTPAQLYAALRAISKRTRGSAGTTCS